MLMGMKCLQEAIKGCMSDVSYPNLFVTRYFIPGVSYPRLLRLYFVTEHRRSQDFVCGGALF